MYCDVCILKLQLETIRGHVPLHHSNGATSIWIYAKHTYAAAFVAPPAWLSLIEWFSGKKPLQILFAEALADFGQCLRGGLGAQLAQGSVGQTQVTRGVAGFKPIAPSLQAGWLSNVACCLYQSWELDVRIGVAHAGAQ